MSDKVSPLARLTPPEGAVKKRKRVGRGTGSGLGKTAGRGNKGQKSRSGGSVHPRFEGGQMPLHMRLPKRGFINPFPNRYVTVNVSDLAVFEDGATLDVEALQAAGLVPFKIQAGVKVLGDGELTKKLTVQAHRFSASARQKIESAGGTVEVIESAK